MTDDEVTMPEHSLPVLFSIKQVAKHLDTSTRTIRRWIEAGDLVAHRIGRGLRISETDLQTFIKTRRDV